MLLHDTVKTAIGRSGGLVKHWPEVAYIYRTDSEGESRKIEVPLGKVLRGQAPDIELQPGDVLDVTFSPGTPPKKRPNIIDVPIFPSGTGRG